MLEYIKKSLRIFLGNRLRAFLTIGGIAVGVTSVVVISSIGEIGKTAVNMQMTNMGMDSFVVTAGEDNYSGLWENDLETLKDVPQVRNAMPLINYYTYTSVLKNSSLTMVWGVNEDADEVIELKTLYGRLINKGDILGKKKVCVVDEQLALDSYRRGNIVGKTVSIKIGGIDEEFEVVGVVSNGVNLLQNMFGDLVPTFVYVPYTTLSNETNQLYFNQIAVKLTDEADTSGISNTLEHAVACGREVRTEIEVENLLRQKNQMNNIADIISVVLAAIAGISLIVSGLSIMTVMLVSVRERTREIGIKKSIGATNMDIMLEFLTEAVIISLLGGIIGVSAGLALSIAAAYIVGIATIIKPATVALLVGFTVLTGILFGVYPAYTASKLRPVEALRIE